MNVVFESAKVEDAASIVEARSKSFYDDFIKYGECPGYNIPLETMKKRISNGIIYKIVYDGKLIGDISIKKKDNQVYKLGCLAIIPEFQNRGIGKDALRFIYQTYPDAAKWELDTPVQDERNCYFYEKDGYHKVSDQIISDRLTIRTYEKNKKTTLPC